MLLRRSATLGFLVFLLGLAACQQATSSAPPHPEPTYSTVNLTIGNSETSISPKTLITTGYQITRKVSGGFLDDTTNSLRYLWGTFEFKNISTTAWNNLTLYAYNQAANNLGGTAFKSLLNSSNVAITDPSVAQSIRPSHGMQLNTGLLQVNPAEADFQGFLTSESTALQTAAVQAGDITSDQVLEYGYVLRNATGGRQINPNELGQVTLGFLVPFQTTTSNNPIKFTITVEIANEIAKRVSRSPEETTAAVLTRATTIGAQQVFFTGLDGDSAVAPVTTLRHVRLRTNTVPDTLGQQIQGSIDAQITGLEREYVAENMRSLPQSQWNEVIFNNGVSISVNRVSLRGKFNLATPIGGVIYRDPATGEDFVTTQPSSQTGASNAPLSPRSTTCSTTSGPFRRVRTAFGLGNPASVFAIARFAYSFATISPPLLADRSNAPGTNPGVLEIPYVYFGSTGLDIGLQYSYTFNNWSLYSLSGGRPTTSSTRLSGGSPVNLTFAVIADNQVRITATQGSTTLTSINQYAPGLKADGTFNKLKRLTTIAQADRLTRLPIYSPNTGAFFAVLWLNMRLAGDGLGLAGLHGWGTLSSDVSEDCVTSATQVQVIPAGSTEEEVQIGI